MNLMNRISSWSKIVISKLFQSQIVVKFKQTRSPPLLEMFKFQIQREQATRKAQIEQNLPPQREAAICEQQQQHRRCSIKTQNRSNTNFKREEKSERERESDKLQGVSPWMLWVRSVCQTLRKFWRCCIFSTSIFGAIFLVKDLIRWRNGST